MDELAESILGKLNGISLDNLAETLPTTITTDAHILEAEKSYSQGKQWNTFHHLSLTHSTLMYHRISHKLHRPQRKNSFSSTSNCTEERNKSQPCPEVSYSANGVRPSTVNETKMLLQSLPSDWTVVQITSEGRQSGEEANWNRVDEPQHTPPLYISRCTGGPSPSLLVQRICAPKGQKYVRSILQEMELIKGENKVINKYVQDDQDKYLCKKEEINSRLRVLVQSMENSWLRYFACLLVGSLPPIQQTQVETLVKEAVRKTKVSLSEEQLAMITLMVSYPPPRLSRGNISSGFPLRAGISSLVGESVRSPLVKNLTAMLLDIRNELDELIRIPRCPVVLILDKSFVSLPWEMTQALQNQSVTRMPSIHSLVHLYMFHAQKSNSLLVKGIDASKGFYIVDPENNLPRSQERLQQTFTLTRWDGIWGQKPSHDQFKEALTNNNVFVYVGHGSGSQYMPAQLVETVECHSLVLLYGCSSASLARRGAIADPWGVILNYLLASCPCVVGMLWEVMDKDTDLLTREMVRALTGQKRSPGSPLEDPPTDFPLLVARARPLCSWYLISAALVVYGLPLHVIPQPETDPKAS